MLAEERFALILDLLARQFAQTMNAANQGCVYDEDGNAMYPLGESNRAKQQAAEQNNSEQ